MHELVDELHELSEAVPVPLELPEHDQLVDAQEHLLMPLPPEFRAFLMTASDVIYGSLEPVTVADPQSHTYLPEVTACAWAQGLPRHLLVLCEYGGGYYCVAQDEEVHYWCAGDFGEQTWETVWDWVSEIWLQR